MLKRIPSGVASLKACVRAAMPIPRIIQINSIAQVIDSAKKGKRPYLTVRINLGYTRSIKRIALRCHTFVGIILGTLNIMTAVRTAWQNVL